MSPSAAEQIAALERELRDVKDRLEREGRSIIVPVATFAPEPYELSSPIQAVVQPAGEGYIASFFDANISASGDTQQDAVNNLKDMVLAVFDDLEEEPRERLGVEAARQLAVLRKMIQRQT